jgi:predicted metal-binding protein
MWWRMSLVTDEVELLVCTLCRPGDTAVEAEPRPGSLLFAELAGLGMEGVRVSPVECLSNCSRACTIALRGPGRWTYVYGGLRPGDAAKIVAPGAGRYRAAPDGLVPWRERPEHFRKNCIARIPPPDLPTPASNPNPNIRGP